MANLPAAGMVGGEAAAAAPRHSSAAPRTDARARGCGQPLLTISVSRVGVQLFLGYGLPAAPRAARFSEAGAAAAGMCQTVTVSSASIRVGTSRI
jgi:hypothetical protein